MYQIGYTTGTFDLTHQGHFEILKKCKFYCQKLIVGLVSDELGVKQKRQPVLSYQHRKDILENSKYVDSVIIFEGTRKQEDFKKLGFDILFISDEYYQKEEYSSFEHDYPNIRVIYFPRTVNISTSDIFKDIFPSWTFNKTSCFEIGITSCPPTVRPDRINNDNVNL